MSITGPVPKPLDPLAINAADPMGMLAYAYERIDGGRKRRLPLALYNYRRDFPKKLPFAARSPSPRNRSRGRHTPNDLRMS